MDPRTLNRILSWPFVFGLAGLLVPAWHGGYAWTDAALTAAPMAVLIVCATFLRARADGPPATRRATAGRCAWAAVVVAGIIGAVAPSMTYWLDELPAPVLFLAALVLGAGVCELAVRGAARLGERFEPLRVSLPELAPVPLTTGGRAGA